MYQSKRSVKAGKKRGYAASSGPAADGGLPAEPEKPVKRATIESVEAHARQQHMYRITLKLEYEESEEEASEQPLGGENEPREWTDEVDEFISSAFNGTTDGEALLTVHEDTLVHLRLLKGRELTAGQYAQLRQEEQKEQAYRAALGMLERKARTTTEIARALKRKGYGKEVVDGCVERLQARKMVDDSAFAKRFAEQRSTNQRKGRRLIRQELLQRGVAKTDVEEAIGEIDGEVERESALALARKRWPSTKGAERERKMKLTAMLLRRGFPPGVTRAAVQQAASEASSNQDDEEWFDDGGMDPMETEDSLD